MARILIAPLTSDETIVTRFRDELRKYGDSVSIFEGDKDTAITMVNGVNALLIVMDEQWQEHFSNGGEGLQQAVTLGLKRQELMTTNVLLNHAALPPVMDLPEELRALAYTNSMVIESADTLERDSRLISKSMYTNFKRMNAAPGAQTPTRESVSASSGSKLPTNLLIVIGVIIIAMSLIVISRLRISNGKSDIPAQINNPDHITVDTLTLGLAAGLSEGSENRGITMINSAELALAQRPTITVNGVEFPIDLVTTDSQCSARGGLQAAENLTSDPGLAAVIGHMCDTSCAAAASRYDHANIPVISPACTQANLADISKTFNRTVPAADDFAIPAAHFIYETLDIQSVMVIHDEILLAGELARLFNDTYTGLGGEVVAFTAIESTTASIPDLVEQIKTANPGLIYFAGRDFNAVRIRQALVQANVDIPYFLADRSILQLYIEGAGNDADGTLIMLEEVPSNDDLDTLTAAYEETYGESPSDLVFAYTYDAVNIVLNSLESTASTDEDGMLLFDRKTLLDAIRTYNGEGIIGTYDCDNKGNCMQPNALPYTIQGGEAVPYESSQG